MAKTDSALHIGINIVKSVHDGVARYNIDDNTLPSALTGRLFYLMQSALLSQAIYSSMYANGGGMPVDMTEHETVLKMTLRMLKSIDKW